MRIVIVLKRKLIFSGISIIVCYIRVQQRFVELPYLGLLYTLPAARKSMSYMMFSFALPAARKSMSYMMFSFALPAAGKT
jgi:hypothetical protein